MSRCLDCGLSISPVRLRAMPSATRCVQCQQGAEAASPRVSAPLTDTSGAVLVGTESVADNERVKSSW